MTVKRPVLTMGSSLAAGLLMGVLSQPLVGRSAARVLAVTVVLAVSTAALHSLARVVRLVPGWLVFFTCLGYLTDRPFGPVSAMVFGAGALALVTAARYALRRP